MLLTKTVLLNLKNMRPNIKDYYKNKGYILTILDNKIEVDVKHLTKGSNVLIKVKCDCEDCNNPYLNPIK